MIRSGLALSLVLAAATLFACGSKNHALDTDASQTIDATAITTDAPPGTPDSNSGPDGRTNDANLSKCDLAKPQCSNGCDDDNDGLIDGFDPQCTGALDNDEGSFATGQSGDNNDPIKQDCFFDGNSGSGNDGCEIHVCCLLKDPNCGVTYYNHPAFDPSTCSTAVTQMCIDKCKPGTPPGCDCFSCCTVCDAQGCVTVDTNPAVAPNCTQDSLRDPNKCPPCTQNSLCSNPCGAGGGSDPCVLCPGQEDRKSVV